jgi:DegV family protein with EDD domain
MSNVRIVTDSTAELPAEVIEALEIAVVPWRIQLDGETLIDTPAIRTPDFYRRRSRILPSAVPPTARQFADVFDRCSRTTHEIVAVLPSSRLTLSVQVARQARAEFVGRCDVQLVDSRFISCALGALVVEAARAARAQTGAAEIVRYVNGLIARTYFAFHAESPEQMLHHNLIENSPVALGSPSGYRPLLLLEQGEIAPLPRSRKRGDPIERMVEFVSEFGPLEHLWTVSTGLHPGLELLQTRLSEDLPDKLFENHIYGPVMASYLGNSVLGVAAIEALL